ncbi:MAG TPA: methyltransferase domain-containing protein [Miltoncostaeaceae bacterium]|nr:methyltransferase domain-containing protein [Miltoncostaeaceae bacterium]
MSGTRYTPGWSPRAVAFMERRTAATHAPEALAVLRPGMDLLDLGCGPGTITVGLARAVAPGRVVAVDADPGQATTTRERAAADGVPVRALAADAAALPLPDASFDAAFAHALLEHVADPVAVLREVRRVLRPGGVAVATSPDWGGFVLAPDDPGAAAAIAAYERLQAANGGDVRAGRRLGGHMAAAGFAGVAMSARYEVYEDRTAIADYLAERLGDTPEAGALRAWGRLPGGLFAQAWVTARGQAPG